MVTVSEDQLRPETGLRPNLRLSTFITHKKTVWKSSRLPAVPSLQVLRVGGDTKDLGGGSNWERETGERQGTAGGEGDKEVPAEGENKRE